MNHLLVSFTSEPNSGLYPISRLVPSNPLSIIRDETHRLSWLRYAHCALRAIIPGYLSRFFQTPWLCTRYLVLYIYFFLYKSKERPPGQLKWTKGEKMHFCVKMGEIWKFGTNHMHVPIQLPIHQGLPKAQKWEENILLAQMQTLLTLVGSWKNFHRHQES